MSDKSKIIIIKKGKKGHAAAHGGSWKVAYADFVTAMMAFFLLMWLLSMSSDEKRARLAEYFKTFSIFEHAGTSFMSQTSQIKQMAGGDIKENEAISKGAVEIRAQDLQEKLKKAVHARLSGAEKNIMIEIADDGVRIQITDPDGTLFAPGSAQPTPKAKEILKVVADNIKDMPNQIALEGHTDASAYSAGKSTNWELSSARASAARYRLEADGVDPDRIARVVGFSDKQLFVPDDPKDPRNRRISILVMTYKGPTIARPSDGKGAEPPPDGVKVIEPKLKPGESLPQPKAQEPGPARSEGERNTGAGREEKKAVAKEKPKAEGPDMGIKPRKPIEFESPVTGKPGVPSTAPDTVKPKPQQADKIMEPKLKPGEKVQSRALEAERVRAGTAGNEKKSAVKEKPKAEGPDMGIKPRKPIEFESPVNAIPGR